MAHPYLKARAKQKWIESAKHLRIPPSPTVWACGFSRGSVKGALPETCRKSGEHTVCRFLRFTKSAINTSYTK